MSVSDKVRIAALRSIWGWRTRISCLRSCLPDYIDRDLHCRDRAAVLQPMVGVPVLGPAHARSVVGGDAVALVGDVALHGVDGAGSVLVVV